MEPTIKVTVKVVDSQGNPLEGVSIRRVHENGNARYVIGHTDTRGEIATVVYPGENAEFLAGWQGKTARKPIVIEDLNPAGDEIVIWMKSEVRK